MSEFDQKAGDWDKNRMNLERTEAVAAQLKKLIPNRPGLSALEFGAGTGLLSFHLKDRFSEITLMDSSKEMLNVAEKKMDESERSKFRTMFLDLENEEYRGGYFDVIYSQMVLHHIKDTRAILMKFHQMLNPGGILVIADLYSEDGSFHDLNMEVHPGFDPEKLKSMLSQNGFQDCQASECFVIRKETSAGKVKEYPVFLLSAFK